MRDETSVTVDLLWTGGWDSTFRVIELLHETDAIIKPHYIKDPQRPSADLELRTMTRLKEALGQKLADVEHRLLPPVITDLATIPPDPRITDAMHLLRTEGHVGLQYEWLARYACHVACTPVELSIEQADHQSFAAQRIRERMTPDTGNNGFSRYKISDGEDAVAIVFGWFRFPIIEYDKTQMREKAEQWGLTSIMYKTWFCHFPLRGGHACGTCRPCVHAMDNGQTWRMGIPGRLRFATIERSRRLLPPRAKAWLRDKGGRRLRRWIRA